MPRPRALQVVVDDIEAAECFESLLDVEGDGLLSPLSRDQELDALGALSKRLRDAGLLCDEDQVLTA